MPSSPSAIALNSYQATQFRIWATQTLREFITKGFVLDDERLKQGKTVFRKASPDMTSSSASAMGFEPATRR